MISILEFADKEVVATPDILRNEEMLRMALLLFTITYRLLIHVFAAGNVTEDVPVKYQTDAVLSNVIVAVPFCFDSVVARAPSTSRVLEGVTLPIPTFPP